MESLIRIVAVLLMPIATILKALMDWLLPKVQPTYPAIRKPILTKSVRDLVHALRRKEVTSLELVSAYIERITEVNAALNAVVDERYEQAIKEANHADNLIRKAKNEFELLQLFTHYPLLGIPFSVKESCGVKGLSFAVGSVVRKNIRCPKDSETVELLRAAGAIPLLVSANPEFCLSFETNTHTHGKCLNPYDLRRTSGGSSGGEGALCGSGATLFGLGSDISGSIRLPAMFCGVFGHKPTGGLVSVKGHFPNSTHDKNFSTYLQMGPITRFARDLPLLLEIMAGANKHKLKLEEQVQLKDIKIYYAYGYSGLNGWTHPPVDVDIKVAISNAVKCFEKFGNETKELDLGFLHNSMEVTAVGLVDLEGIPSIVTQHPSRSPSLKMLIIELFHSLIGHSLFTKEALLVEVMQRFNGGIWPSHMERYREEREKLKTHLSELLGTNGVLFLPTFHTSALHFHTSMIHFSGIDGLLLYNILGFPATHVPMGLDKRGLPIGFQVIAAPYQDKLCLQIAAELEGAFGGWVPPLPNNFND